MGDIEAAGEENVVMHAGSCVVTILPHLGGKIASIKIGDEELLQSPLLPYAPRTQTMGFDEGDASGWDECLPTVSACILETAAGPTAVPDHGDLWRVEWTTREDGTGNGEQPALPANENALTLTGQCFSLPLRLERTVQLTNSAEGYRLQVEYSLTNTGSLPAPWSWAAHPLFVAEAGDRILLPDKVRTLCLAGSGGDRLGRSGDTVTWPFASLQDGSLCDLSLAQGPASEIGDKLFAGPLAEAENWCALVRPRAGLRITVRFNPAATPYLGLWICYAGWPERPGPKQQCVALEPATAPEDSLAVTGPWSRVLAPGESFSWGMTVEIESIVSVN